jgi:arabinose-5-phosphate isomerase
VIVSGIGKSGIAGRMIAAALACTGTPAVFLHPTDASHGDLGMVTSSDVVILVSQSGETGEILWLLPHLQRIGVPLIAITGEARSSIARAAAVTLEVVVPAAALAHAPVPTTSALVAQALGDALALAVLQARGLSTEEVQRFHPGSPAAFACRAVESR